jgi:hypothetical protein
LKALAHFGVVFSKNGTIVIHLSSVRKRKFVEFVQRKSEKKDEYLERLRRIK